MGLCTPAIVTADTHLCRIHSNGEVVISVNLVNMLILVGAVKMADRLVKEMMGI